MLIDCCTEEIDPDCDSSHLNYILVIMMLEYLFGHSALKFLVQKEGLG